MTGDEQMMLVRVRMPEKGCFWVRAESVLPRPGEDCLVTLDYGVDVGRVLDCVAYDPSVHGPRPPSFTFVRTAEAGDAAVMADNAKIAASICSSFIQAARSSVPDISVPYARLSYGRAHFFVRFISGRVRPDLTTAVSEIKRLFNVSISTWQIGARDEVGIIGGLGPCGRVCCCASWQSRYPTGLSSASEHMRTVSGGTNSLNGTCGRFKCCLAFEAKEPPSDRERKKNS